MTDYVLTINAENTPTFRMDLDKGFSSDQFILHSMQVGQCYEAEVTQILTRALRPGDTAFDIGANVGYFTCLMATLVGPTGRVRAYEPGENNLPRLRVNIALNKFDNVEVITAPVWSHETEVTFWLNHDNTGGNGLWDPGKWHGNPKSRAAPAPRTLRTTTLDRTYLQVPRVIKMDIEGAEYHAMVGARGLLKHKPPFIIAEWNQFAFAQMETSGEELRDLLRQHGYDLFLIATSGERPVRVKPDESLRLPEGMIINVLFSTEEAVTEIWGKPNELDQ